MSVSWNDLIARDARVLVASEIRDLLKVAERPEVISFAGGVPDPDLFPVETFRDIYGAMMQDGAQARRSLQYSVSEGLPALRQWIVDDLAEQGARRTIDNVLITNGAQQGLDILARLLLEEGRDLIVEKPSYLGAMQAFSTRLPNYVGVDAEDEGPVLSQLEDAFAKGARVAYVAPDFQNPTGRSWSIERRKAVLDLACRHGAVLIEDAAYSKLSYSGAESLPSLLSLDDQGSDLSSGNVIQLGTFSKTLAPALRIGWVCAPRPVIDKLVLMMQAGNLHVSTVNQEAALRAATKLFPAHLEKLRTSYRAKRDVMLQTLTETMPEDVSWTRPEGGMFVWLTLPEHINARQLLEEALEDVQVAFVPGQAFFTDGSGKNTARLSFSTEKMDRIKDGITRLADLIRRKDNQ
ncbi:PLP-dependent aminotransferase family protein [Thalassospira sp. HF15]|uniref:aminotransferase-like domain-containing protein n=1 Tax=Thalassospira sp. HF15 TaxID=2722755 RepID=UPI00142F48BF|nr:PLP-dependent aminotransferase family protein [Thalassospira sp. HF15]NIY77312.1 PLP-dependent aminotransferase family protein [Thalassospira sp. HF15]